MGRNASPSTNKRSRSPRDASRRPGKKKVCSFCADRSALVDYKDANVLRRYISDRGKIKARRVSGLCVQHQREVAVAVKTARELALLPYSVRASAERGRGGGRGRDGDRGLRLDRPPAVIDTEPATPDAADIGVEATAVAPSDAVAGPSALDDEGEA
jgi:small subunit ribosomal protein S18